MFIVDSPSFQDPVVNVLFSVINNYEWSEFRNSLTPSASAMKLATHTD